MRAELPAQVVELVDAFRNPITQIEFLYLLANANILEPVLVDAETADRMVRPYSWFLDRVSPEGIKLTSTGYLPPADVEAASAELDLAREWIGKHNREAQTCPCSNCASRRCAWACSASTAACCWPLPAVASSATTPSASGGT
jgi:hypothetical protein